jgi:hypothetical protein
MNFNTLLLALVLFSVHAFAIIQTYDFHDIQATVDRIEADVYILNDAAGYCPQ